MSASELLGKIFQEKRKRRSLEIEDVSGKTYINIGIIIDIESGVFDKLSPVYMRSFIKKYSNFLELNVEEMLKQYEGIVSGSSVKAFSTELKQPTKKKKATSRESISPEKEKKVSLFHSLTAKKKVQIISAVLLAVVFMALVVTLIRVTNKVLTSPPRVVPVVAPSKVSSSPVPAPKIVPNKIKRKSIFAKKEVKPIAANSPVTLILAARDRVWVQVASSSGGKIFDGFLKDGDSRTWKGTGTFTIWTGKANMLDFTVNGNDLGVVASGVVRNIKVSAEGVFVGDDWVIRFR